MQSPVDIPHHAQETEYTCGPASLKMALEPLLGIHIEEEKLARELGTNQPLGTRQRVLAAYVDELGLEAVVRHTTTTVNDIADAMAEGYVVVVCYWLAKDDTDHYAVVSKITPTHVVLQDPWTGPQSTLTRTAFAAQWRGDPKVPLRRNRWMLCIRSPA